MSLENSKVSIKTLYAVIGLCLSIVFGVGGIFLGRATVFVELAKMNVTIEQHSERIRDLEQTRAALLQKFIGVDEKFLSVQKQLEEIKDLIRNGRTAESR